MKTIDVRSVLDDPALPEATLALDRKRVESEFQRKLKTLTNHGGTVELHEVRVLRHKPGRRCVIEYEIVVRRSQGYYERLSLIGKLRAKRFGKSGYRRLKSVWDAGFGDGHSIRVPEPIGVVHRFHIWLQRKVDGPTFTELLLRQANTLMATNGVIDSQLLDHAKKVGESVHKFSNTRIPLESVHSIERENAILQERLPTITSLSPALRDRVESILRCCNRLAEMSHRNIHVPIHRDFYSDQVIVNDDAVFLLDFDLCCLGDPALDIGNFTAHVSELSLRHLADPFALSEVETAIEESFIELAGEEHRDAIRIYKTLSLVRHIYLSTLFPERTAFTKRIIEMCEERLTYDMKQNV